MIGESALHNYFFTLVSTLRRKLSESRRRMKKEQQHYRKTFRGLFDRRHVFCDPDNGRMEAMLPTEEKVADRHAKGRLGSKTKELRTCPCQAKIPCQQNKAGCHTTPIKKFNFREPTEKMILDAETHGIDLLDSRVVAILEELQTSQMQSLNGNIGFRYQLNESDGSGKACLDSILHYMLLIAMCRFLIFLCVSSLTFREGGF